MSKWASGALLSASIIALAATGVDAAPKAAKEQSQSEAPKHLGIGRQAKPTEIAGWDIDIRPDGLVFRPARAR